VQAQVLNLLRSLQDELGLSYLFISHDLAVVRPISMRVVVLYRGKVMEAGPAAAVYSHPAHPYTRALLESVPIPNPNLQRARLQELGLTDVRRRNLGWRMWWGGPWFPTRLVTATKHT